MNGAVRGVILGVVIAVVLASCIVRRLTGPHLTGTCEGACDHYIECKPSHSDADAKRCRSECPDVFSDRQTLMEYERMSCQNAVEYVDGTPARSASQR